MTKILTTDFFFRFKGPCHTKTDGICSDLQNHAIRMYQSRIQESCKFPHAHTVLYTSIEHVRPQHRRYRYQSVSATRTCRRMSETRSRNNCSSLTNCTLFTESQVSPPTLKLGRSTPASKYPPSLHIKFPLSLRAPSCKSGNPFPRRGSGEPSNTCHEVARMWGWSR